MENQRNLILAVVLTGLLLFGWDAGMRHFYPDANKPKAAASASPAPQATASAKPTREGGLTSVTDIAAEARDLKTALDPAGRVAIAAPGLSGSINLHGGLIDDLSAVRHSQTIDKSSGPARIFSPAGTPAQQYAQFGWTGQNVALPDGNTIWTAPAGSRLTPQTPVTLVWTNPTGLTFGLTYAIDADYMISVKQSVQNGGATPVTVDPFAMLNRTSHTASVDSFNVHSGPIGAFGDGVDFSTNYGDVAEKGVIAGEGKTDWIGFTDIYWMSTLIPGTNASRSQFKSLGDSKFEARLDFPQTTLAAGQSSEVSNRLFAGAKESPVLDRYEAAGVPVFGLAIDWGWFRWFEKPIFKLLSFLFNTVHNFGIAIMLLTLIVRGLMFPIAQKQFASMAAMKAIQPKMKALQERWKDDKQRQQQEIMALYKKEGVNPLAGCLPIFLQIPVFFALYKVLTLAVEMRHQPFFGWIKDLSAPDPLHVLNLFGLLDFTPPAFLGIGVLAILLGVTMWLQFRLNPAQMDPVQQQVFAIMPWMMMFVMAPFAAGMLIYWITSNVLTIAQQKYLYSRHPQLKAQAEKDAADAERSKARSG